MSFFTSKKRGAADPIITVSAETLATVSKRVKLESQIIEFEADPNSSSIVFATRANTQDYSRTNKKGLVLKFDKNIQSGTYNNQEIVAYYFETASRPGRSEYIEFHATTGSYTVEAIENSDTKLHYQIGFEFKGLNESNEELQIKGQSTYIVLMKAL
ncbi:hypothetical protein KVG95_02370 [Pseudomonas sp. SWRI79]|uniref:Uncharacterized protein n=1 Tax=Pseudomonas farris TaxID=2841207 RepID=A0ABS6PNY4_9PSED|nr:hypothetical protein [Pseudomonas farris]MBV4462174.1 hypothetical protein [Pseudomonas farris]